MWYSQICKNNTYDMCLEYKQIQYEAKHIFKTVTGRSSSLLKQLPNIYFIIKGKIIYKS